MCSTRTLNEVVDRVTSSDSSSSDLIRLSLVCCRPALLSSTTSSVVFVSVWSVYPVVVRQRLVRQLFRLSCCRYWDRRSCSSTFVEDTVRLGRRRSARLFGNVEPRHLRRRLLCRAASSCRSSSTTTRHSTTSSTTSVLRRRLRPYPFYTSRAHARRLGTFVCKLWVLTNLWKVP